MRKLSIIMAIVMALTLMTASVALAGPTCSDFDGGGIFANHGDHVTTAYATPGDPGAVSGGPAHFTNDFSPGASFCEPGKAGESQALPNLSGGPPA